MACSSLVLSRSKTCTGSIGVRRFRLLKNPIAAAVARVIHCLQRATQSIRELRDYWLLS